MKTTNIASICFALIALLVASAASAITVTIDEVQVDDTVVTLGAVNRLDVTRPSEIEVEIRMSATQNVRNMEIQALISGYEHNRDERIMETTPLFDADANITYVKKLSLRLPDNVKEDDYLLRITATDRNSVELVQNYRLKLDVPRHDLVIEDVILSPSDNLKAGSALLTTVRLENQGEKDEQDVKVTVSMPELGISAADYIDEIDSDDQEETEEIYLRVPRCVKAGEYTVDVTVEYNEFHDSFVQSQRIMVVQDDTCNAGSSVVPIVKQEQALVPLSPVEPKASAMSKLRGALEVSLLVLLGILVLIGLIVGLSRLKEE